MPPGLTLRPLVTGWFAEFASKSATRSWGTVEYAAGADALGGATYDPASHYRAARVFDFFAEQGLEPGFLRAVSQHQVGLLAARFDELALPDDRLTRDRGRPLAELAGFLALESPHAPEISRRLLARGVFSDARETLMRMFAALPGALFNRINLNELEFARGSRFQKGAESESAEVSRHMTCKN